MELKSIGVTPQKEKQFISRGIESVEALASYLPTKYKDFTHITGLVAPPGISCLVVHVDRIQTYNNRVSIIMVFCTVQPTGERVIVKFFNQRWMSARLGNCVNRNVYVAGKAVYNEQYNNFSITSPDLFEPNIEKGMKMYPVYRKVTGMSNDYLTGKIQAALSRPDATAETCPKDIVQRYGQVSRKEALGLLHFPRNINDVRVGQERILFDDLLYFAASNVWAERKSAKGSPFNVKTLKSYNAICNSLPFNLTPDQSAAIDGMVAHIRSGLRLNALLQGDVGCGKSIVAFILMAIMADSGYQSILMAPTQVLARQHYDDLVKLMGPLGHRVAYLGGGGEMKAAEKRKLLAQIKAGDVDIIVGTHSVIGKNVEYARLGLVIADEEHRFGVAQRAALVEKAQGGVHSITMSATPIPRSLAQVVYGDTVQLYTIKTMPVGRLPVMTGIAKGREKIYRFIISQKRKGMQTYVVCPMIDKNDDLDGVKSVEEISAEYCAALGPYGVRISTLTGRDSKEQTEAVISAFRAGDIDVLIATTVIEVGVNVPRASTIVITNAERFGLSTLHQLRGRVGRGKWQSYCVLESDAQTDTGRQRLEVMCSTTDGFKIAEADLKIRGAGDFLGTQQSGENKYMTLMLAFPEKYQLARTIANELLDRGDDCCPLVQRVANEQKEAD